MKYPVTHCRQCHALTAKPATGLCYRCGVIRPRKEEAKASLIRMKHLRHHKLGLLMAKFKRNPPREVRWPHKRALIRVIHDEALS